MYKHLIALAVLAGPAFGAGLEIDIAGEANGTITIDLFEDVAPLHTAQITAIAAQGGYDNVVFHHHMARKHAVVREDDVITNDTVVGDVAIGEVVAMATQHRFPVFRCATVNRDVLTKHIVAADL